MECLALLDPSWRLLGALSLVDVAILAALAVGAGLGFWSGFAWQLVRLLSLVVAVGVALAYSPVVAEGMGRALPASARVLVSTVAVLMAVLLVCYLIAYLVRGIVNAFRPQMSDRILGAVLGAVQAGLIVAVVAFLALEYSQDDSAVHKHAEESRAAVFLGTCTKYVLPDGVRERLDASHLLGGPSV